LLRSALLFAFTLLALPLLASSGTTADEKPARPAPPALVQFLKLDVDGVLRRLDKNHDGYLTKDELPPALAKAFANFDSNGDGKLDREEIARMMQRLRRRFGIKLESQAAKPEPSKGKNSGEVDALVEQWLARMDKNKDGKISRDEAKGPLEKNFDAIDVNKDGYLDRQELRRVAERILQNRKANAGRPAGPAQPDFDALDRNADGRLTRDELRGTPFYDHFDEIDTNKDGKINRQEFEAYLSRQAEKQADKQAKEEKK
jgi:Ca2+-binding EF-hand superfamily protein